MASTRIDNTRYRIKKDSNLSDDEKEYLLNKISTDNIDDVVNEKNIIIVSKVKFVCTHCKEEFKPDHTHRNFLKQKFCSIEHQQIFLNRSRASSHLGDIKRCECGKEFTMNSAQHKYCKECSEKYAKIKRQESKQRFRSLLPKKEPRIKVVKEKIPKPKKEKVVLSESDILKKKFLRRQKAIDNMDNFFKACAAQIKLNEEITIHFPEGLNV